MKGIKTEVKTEWENLAHGNTRHYDFRSGEYPPTISGFKVGDTLKMSVTVRWRLADEGTGGILACDNFAGDYVLGIYASGDVDKDNVIRRTATWTATKDNTLHVYSPKWMGQFGAKRDENSYIIIENLMVSKDDFLPYIDSDELKEMGGAINKARIVALVLSEERRAA